MREKIIEQQLVQAVKHKGGSCPKSAPPDMTGCLIDWCCCPMDALPLWSLKHPERKCVRYRYIGSAS